MTREQLRADFEKYVAWHLDEIRSYHWSPASNRYIPMFERPDPETGQRPDPVEVCRHLLTVVPTEKNMYTSLRAINRLDLCSEALVEKFGPPNYSEDIALFTKEEVATAKWKMANLP